VRYASRMSTQTIVLLVEDDPFMAEVMSDVLDYGGYAVERAATAAEALILCNDIRRATDVPIVVVSGTNRKRDAVLSLRLGADDFVAKPFDVAELEERIKTVLKRAA
jgi:DNA-binding response OmpR family regulator